MSCTPEASEGFCTRCASARRIAVLCVAGGAPGGVLTALPDRPAVGSSTLCRASALYATLQGDALYATHQARPQPDSTDAARDAICNIYDGGLNPLEAGAHAVQLIQKMIQNKASGVELKRT